MPYSTRTRFAARTPLAAVPNPYRTSHDFVNCGCHSAIAATPAESESFLRHLRPWLIHTTKGTNRKHVSCGFQGERRPSPKVIINHDMPISEHRTRKFTPNAVVATQPHGPCCWNPMVNSLERISASIGRSESVALPPIRTNLLCGTPILRFLV